MAQRLCNRRPKKFLGAVIGAATGLAGSIIGGIEQNNAAKRQARQQKYDAALQSASSLNQAYSGDSEYSKNFNDRYSLEFGNGGNIRYDKNTDMRTIIKAKPAKITGSGQTLKINGDALVKNGRIGGVPQEEGLSGYDPIAGAFVGLGGIGGIKAAYNGIKAINAGIGLIRNTPRIYLGKGFQNATEEGIDLLKKGAIGVGNLFTPFKNGGIVSGNTNINIKNGGVAQPIGDGLSLLRGRKHTDGGIDIDVADKKIEAESGEVLQPTDNGLRIFSAKSMPGVGVPAKEVIENPSASDSIFAKQQLYKQRNGLTDSGKKKAFGDYLGIKRTFDNSSPEAFTKDVKSYAAKKEMGQQIGDMTSTAVNIATPIISGLFGMSAAKKLQNPARPTLYRAAALKTDYNINPQLSEIDKNQYRADAEIDNNTISSVAGLARKQRVGVEALGQKNTLLGQKENIETELQNNAALNRQQVDNQNTAALNDYNNRLAETENNRSAIRVNSLNGMLSGLAGAGRDFQSRLDARKEKNDTLKAIVAGDSTNSTAVMMKKGAFDDNPDALEAFMNSSDPAIAAEARRRRGYTGRDYSIGTTKSTNTTLYPSLTGSVSRLVKPVWQK